MGKRTVKTLESMRGWIRHWQEDRAHGLKPTAESLAYALAELDVEIAELRKEEQVAA